MRSASLVLLAALAVFFAPNAFGQALVEPAAFRRPIRTMASAGIPAPGDHQTGVLENSAAHFSKKYGLTIAPTAGSVLADAYAAVGTIKVQWQ